MKYSHRHDPMVTGVCRRTLRHRQDAEGAFQATFLLLAHRASELRARALGKPPAALIECGAAAAVTLLVGSERTDFLNPGQTIDKSVWTEQAADGIAVGRDYVRVRFGKPK